MSKKQDGPKRPISKAEFLGDYVLSPFHFEGLDGIFKGFHSEDFSKLNHKEKSERVNHALLELILAAPEGSGFLLIAVLFFIDRVHKEELLVGYNLSSFELWLNQFSGLGFQENYKVRGKVVGKWVPRDEYQILFPIGMGKVHPGSHFVTAHASPDLDTTIASFWGWVDAFGARVAEGLHVWNVPGGVPASSIEVAVLFQHVFGQRSLQYMAKTRTRLSLSSLELMTQRGVVKQKTDQSSLAIDHERAQKAIILVDDQGYFLGDWRSFDVEGVRQVIMLLNNCLRWFENNLHVKIVSLFAKEDLSLRDLPGFVEEVFEIKVKDCDPADEFTDKQKRWMDGYLRKVLFIEKGLEATFSSFAKGMKKLGVADFQKCIDQVDSLSSSSLFDQKGQLVEDRPQIFHYLEEIIAVLDRAIYGARLYTERLEVALNIKTKVFGYLPQVVSYRADVDELKSKMGNYPYLTVTSTNEEGQMIPLGVVRGRDLHQQILGTVSLRDFCNREETKIPSYLEVISVIDHHKTVLQTSSVPVVHISDAQSSNAVVAQLAFVINDKYSTGGMSLAEIEGQMKKVQGDIENPKSKRLMQRLLDRYSAAKHLKEERYFVDPLREFIEYLHFLYAIIDDTDLLTKVSRRDIECVASLLNRLKSLMEGEELEIIEFDDLPQDKTFVQKAATRILKNPDMYSIYRKTYVAKEQLMEESLKFCAEGKESNVFIDTKLQNGCCRVGQTKIFPNNLASFASVGDKLRATFVDESKDFFADRREVDLYLHMISSIAGAEDLFSGVNGEFQHKDELWVWIPMTEQSIEHLKGFLGGFHSSRQILDHEKDLEVVFMGPGAAELSKIFKENFPCPHHHMLETEKKTMAVIRYKAGTINSRKSMISPYLPKLIS
ncbi:MAG: hypothetical protein KR126chlam1_01244 [Chlamydiae bacterium]|nr:hypothetical protein [Chlamydiota bacterium]